MVDRHRVEKRLAEEDLHQPRVASALASPRRTVETSLPCLDKNPTTRLRLVLVWQEWELRLERTIAIVEDLPERDAWKHNVLAASFLRYLVHKQ